MKRNRLISSSNRKKIFSTSALRMKNHRNLMVLSSLTIVSIFVTSLVFATNKPNSSAVHSQVISLPTLSTETQNESPSILSGSNDNLDSTTTPVASELNKTDSVVLVREVEIAAVKKSLSPDLGSTKTDVQGMEQAETEQYHLTESKIELIDLAKPTNIEPKIDWQNITVKSGDNLSLIFPRVGLSARDVYNVAQLGKDIKPLLNLKPDQVIRFDITEHEGSKSLQQLQLELSSTKTLYIVAVDGGFSVKQHSPNIEQVEVAQQTLIKIEEDSNIILNSASADAQTKIVEQKTEQHDLTKVMVELVDLTLPTSLEPQTNWQNVTVEAGDNLSLIFPRIGLSARDVYNVARLGKEVKPLLNLTPGQVIRFDITEHEGSKSLQQLQLELSPIKMLDIVAVDSGYKAKLHVRDVESRQTHASGTIEHSLFGAGLEAGLSGKLIMELAYIFGWDIDFALDLRKGDSFTMIYSEDFLDGDKISDGAILAAEFTNNGKTFRAVRYTDDNACSLYYSPEGASMRKAFSRTPVHFSRISSKFNPNRKHPVLKTSRPHRGVDYAASRGTPILATGDGKISFRGTKGGYGRTVVLSHAGKYTTLYAHMSNFKRGLKVGSRVKQGQTIGFIGSTGLATGPHLHYEFRVKGVHRNPLTVKLPKAKALAKKYRTDFKKKSQPLLAQLDKIVKITVAVNDVQQ